jgi:hypothetical protein
MNGMDDDTFIAHLDTLAESYGYDVEDIPTVDEVLSGIRKIESKEVSLVYALVTSCCHKIKENYDKIGKPNIFTDEQVINLINALEGNVEFAFFALKALLAILKIELDSMAKSSPSIVNLYTEFEAALLDITVLHGSTI